MFATEGEFRIITFSAFRTTAYKLKCGLSQASRRISKYRGDRDDRSDDWGSGSKRRQYDRQILGRIRIILLARDAGFTVSETRTFLGGFPLGATPATRWRAMAKQKLSELDALMARARRLRTIGRCQEALAHDSGSDKIERIEGSAPAPAHKTIASPYGTLGAICSIT